LYKSGPLDMEWPSCGGLGGLRPPELISAPLVFSAVCGGHHCTAVGCRFPHKHHGAIPSRYAQIRAGEFGGRTKDEGAQLVF
jgi:hypothetical protein